MLKIAGNKVGNKLSSQCFVSSNMQLKYNFHLGFLTLFFFNHLKNFIKYKFKTNDIKLKDIKNNFLDEFEFYLKIDVDKHQDISDKFKVRGVPTFVLCKSGEILWRQSGGMDINTLVTKIKSAI